MKAPKISIIIPVLNEAVTIQKTLSRMPQATAIEVIVVDGGSQDETVTTVQAFGIKVLSSPVMGRARQMNYGAAFATGDILLFLHADTYLPTEFDRLVRQALQGPGIIAGAFELAIDAQLRGLRMVETMVNWRSRFLSMPYGDQAIFVKTAIFQEIGGFPDLPIMEDFELMRCLKRCGKITIVPAPVLTSGRRWQKLGIAKTTLINQLIIVAYLLGVSPKQIVRWYRQG